MCVYIYMHTYILSSEVAVLQREKAVKVEALCVLTLLYISVFIPLYMCSRRSEVAVLETEHAVKREGLVCD